MDGPASVAGGWQDVAGIKGVSDHVSLLIHYASLACLHGGGGF